MKFPVTTLGIVDWFLTKWLKGAEAGRVGLSFFSLQSWRERCVLKLRGPHKRLSSSESLAFDQL